MATHPPVTRATAITMGVLVTAVAMAVGLWIWAQSRPTVIDAGSVEALKETVTRAERELPPIERTRFRRALYVHAYPMKLETLALEDVVKLPPPTISQLGSVNGMTAHEVIREAQVLYEMAHKIRLLGLEQQWRELELRVVTLKEELARIGETGPYSPPRMVAFQNAGMHTAILSVDFANRSAEEIGSAMLAWRMFVPDNPAPVARGDIRLTFDEPLLPGARLQIDERVDGLVAAKVAKNIGPDARYQIDVVRIGWADGTVSDMAALWEGVPQKPEEAIVRLGEEHEALRLQVPRI